MLSDTRSLQELLSCISNESEEVLIQDFSQMVSSCLAINALT
jgi:hypothetical protein